MPTFSILLKIRIWCLRKAYLFPAAEKLSPVIYPELFNFILTWFCPLHFSRFSLFFFFSTVWTDKTKKSHAKFSNIWKPSLLSADEVTWNVSVGCFYSPTRTSKPAQPLLPIISSKYTLYSSDIFKGPFVPLGMLDIIFISLVSEKNTLVLWFQESEFGDQSPNCKEIPV